MNHPIYAWTRPDDVFTTTLYVVIKRYTGAETWEYYGGYSEHGLQSLTGAVIAGYKSAVPLGEIKLAASWWAPAIPPDKQWDHNAGCWVPYEPPTQTESAPSPVPAFVTKVLETFDATDPYAAWNTAQHKTRGAAYADGSRRMTDYTRVRERLNYYKRTLTAIPMCPEHGATVVLEASGVHTSTYRVSATIQLRCTECEVQP